MSPGTVRPLDAWRFAGTLRHYQADVLERVDVDGGRPLHIVAPPGSGKTLLGLLLAARRGRRTLVLAPTVTIRSQWARSAVELAPDPAAVSEDPANPADLTALTYQALSVLDARNPLAALAAARWRDELEADGRSPEAAARWIADLSDSNPAAHRSGIARRSRRLRRRLVREDPAALAAALHPNARALVDRLVAHGVETIVLDECHHLLDHWALVVAALVARLRAEGRAPLVVGLTATLPSPDDADEYDNYTSLLGEVDYEVPVPAVVREGNLAPYRDLVRFVEPTGSELAFLEAHATGLAVLIRTTFARDEGLRFVVDALQPELPAASQPSELEPPPVAVDDSDARLAAAFSADFARAESAAAMLSTVAPRHPLVALLPDVARRPPTTDEALRLLGRFALDRVLPDAALAPQWDRIRRTLADFGYGLTDRGLRRTRDPVDTLLASSLAKDHAVCDILGLERGAIGDDRLRALVVTDYAEHGNRQGGLAGGAGALRTFDVLVADAATRRLRAVLVTGVRTRIATRDADVLVPALADLLGVAVDVEPVDGAHGVSQVRAPGVGAAALVRAVSELLTRGTIQIVVGTRGLFGEGWDCPAVNTLIDLTAVATASATQQLRGRTLRLDPAWPGKVAHNWTVTALLPPSFPLESAPDAARLRRKHARLWGLDRDASTRIVRGLSTVMPMRQQAALRSLLAKDAAVSVAALDDLAEPRPRALTHADWRIGEPYVDREGVSALVSRRIAAPVFRTSRPAAVALGGAAGAVGAVAVGGTLLASFVDLAAGVVAGIALAGAGLWSGIPLVRAWWRARGQTTRTAETYRRVATVVWRALARGGRVTGGAPAIEVAESLAAEGMMSVSIGCPDASLHDQRMLADALAELFGPVRTPRFLLEVDRGGRSWAVRAVLIRTGDDRGRLLPVPSAIGRRREDAEAFAAEWDREIGAAVLHAIDHPDQLALAARARRGGGGDAVPAPSTRESWI